MNIKKVIAIIDYEISKAEDHLKKVQTEWKALSQGVNEGEFTWEEILEEYQQLLADHAYICAELNTFKTIKDEILLNK